MQSYRKSSHAPYDLKYHMVWIIKYRKLITDSNKNTAQSGIIKLNEGFGIGREYFTKNRDNKKSSGKDE